MLDCDYGWICHKSANDTLAPVNPGAVPKTTQVSRAYIAPKAVAAVEKAVEMNIASDVTELIGEYR